MDTVKEFFDAIKGQLSERLANPFTGAFCIAWVIWNFRLLMVFAGKGNYQEKFLYVDTNLYPDIWYWLVRGAALPMATAVIYLWGYPRATSWLAEDYRKQQTRASNLMKAAEGTSLLSIEESRALRLRFAEAEQQWNDQRDQLVKEVDAQRKTAAGLVKERDEMRNEILQFRAQANESSSDGGVNLVFSEPAAFKRGIPLVSSTKEAARFKLSPSQAERVPHDVAHEQYTRVQLRILSVLREGNRLDANDLVNRLALSAFDMQRALDRLRALKLVGKDSELNWFATEIGRTVLGAFVDSNQWNFATEGL